MFIYIRHQNVDCYIDVILPEGFEDEYKAAIKVLEAETYRKYANSDLSKRGFPLLFSIRGSAEFENTG